MSSSDQDVRRAAAAFARPSLRRSCLQLLTSVGPFLAGCAAMYLVYPVSPWLTLALSVPTGLFLVRVFIVQHDCGHGAFFRAPGANRQVGRLCSLITLTPYTNWASQHGAHHANWNNLDRRTAGADIYSACLTVREYQALSRGRRLLYRLPRHPLIAHVLLPPLIFLLLYRLPFDTPRAWVRERLSVHLTNAALVAMFGLLVVLLGWREVVLVHVPIIAVGSIVGVWLFSLQHRFETARWSADREWNFVAASLDGSSWLRLPRILHWFTGNIGFHHVHHLSPRVPNYRLRACHDAVNALHPAQGLSLLGGLQAPRLTLWDEARGRLVRFADAERRGPTADRSRQGCR